MNRLALAAASLLALCACRAQPAPAPAPHTYGAAPHPSIGAAGVVVQSVTGAQSVLACDAGSGITFDGGAVCGSGGGGGGGGATGPAGATGASGATGPGGATGATGATGAGAVTTRLTPTDSNTLLHWTLDEGATPYANTGAGGTLNLADSNTPIDNATGLLGGGVLMPVGVSSYIKSADTTIEPSTTAVTVSLWLYAFGIHANGGIFAKAYNAGGGWTSPYATLYMNLANDTTGNWNSGITVSGTQTTHLQTDICAITPDGWHFLAITYNGTALNSYYDGNLCGTALVSGSLDFGTHGLYEVGGVSGSTQFFYGTVDDIRVDSIVRSQATIRAMYQDGLYGSQN